MSPEHPNGQSSFARRVMAMSTFNEALGTLARMLVRLGHGDFANDLKPIAGKAHWIIAKGKLLLADPNMESEYPSINRGISQAQQALDRIIEMQQAAAKLELLKLPPADTK